MSLIMPIKDLTGDRLLRFEESLWDDSARNALSLGCRACPDFGTCGGLHLKGGGLDCSEFCCGEPDACDGDVCRSNAQFAKRHMEVGGFRFDNIRRTAPLPLVDLPAIVPVIFHGNKRTTPFEAEAVTLKLYSLFDRRTGQPRYRTRGALCDAFRISPAAKIVITGIEKDRQVEGWWELSVARRTVVENLRELGIDLVTTPNFTLHLNRPRQGDLYSMKRIALAHQEFLAAGVQAALHVNGRTDHDFERWTKFLQEREEIKYVSYEFTTGTSRAERRRQHTRWLTELAINVKQPLHLVVAGGLNSWPDLASAFASVIVLETSTFMRTIYRMGAVAVGNAGVEWMSAPTLEGEPLNELLQRNHGVVSSAYGLLAARPIS